jgi:serine phosphatase RsbU (regulator of sigma subunit)
MANKTSRHRADRSNLEQEIVQREAELAIINSIQQGLASHLEVQAIYDLVGEKIRAIFKAQIVMISTYDPHTDTIEHRYAIEQGERVYAPGQFPIRGFRTQIVQTRQPVLVGSYVAEQAAILGQPTLPGTITPKTWLGVPMLVGDQVTGILSLQNVEMENAFSESDVRLLQTLAASMSVALENARLFDETQHLLKETKQRNAELAIINSVQAGLASQLDMKAIYELVGDKIREIFDANTVVLATFDLDKDLMHRHYTIEQGKRYYFEPMPIPKIWSYFIRQGQPALINNNLLETMQQIDPDFKVPAGEVPKCSLTVPLKIRGELRGAISLQNVNHENAFSESDLRLLETLANSMSVALENARLWEQEKIYLMGLEHEFAIGREIQAGFLPDILPQPQGWEIAASLQPAREVAGDFYDVFELPEKKIGLVIADVCDKGLGAALFMTLFRSFIRAVSNIDFYARTGSGYGNSSTERLKSAISLTNNYIVETHGNTGMFATIFFGIFDPRTGLMTYINCGHLPPMLINKHGVKEILTLTGPAVGGELDANYSIRDVMIEPGDTLFAYTDGITDTSNPAGDYFSEKDLIPMILGEQALSSMLAQIQKQIERFSAGAQQIDDITMLAVKHRKNDTHPPPIPRQWGTA